MKKHRFKSGADECLHQETEYIQLKRYTHESTHDYFINNRKYPSFTTIQASILCFVCGFVFILVITQIIILHKNDKALVPIYQNAKKIQEELKLMDKTMNNLIRSNNTLTIHQWIKLNEEKKRSEKFKKFLNETYSIDDGNEFLGIFDDKISLRFNYDEKLNILLQTISNSHKFNIKINKNDCSVSFFLNNYSFEHKFKHNICSNFNSDIAYNSSTSRVSLKIYDNQLVIIDLPFKQNFSSNTKSPLCDPVSLKLKGRISVNESQAAENYIKLLNNLFSEIQMGGIWRPKECKSRHKVAIIIPYRDRFEHLRILLSYLHEILQRQELSYKIYVTEQYGNGTFNKGILMNSAFIYAENEFEFDCFCFHDVDLIPEDDRNLYACPDKPRHMSPAVDELNYRLTYEELVGGVLNLRKDHLLAVNGYSNLYWGWGAEDDDMYYRITKGAQLKIDRPVADIGRYKMSKHEKRRPQEYSKRLKLLYSSTNRMLWDGISSVKYNLIRVTKYKLYTHLLVDVGNPPPGFA